VSGAAQLSPAIQAGTQHTQNRQAVQHSTTGSAWRFSSWRVRSFVWLVRSILRIARLFNTRLQEARGVSLPGASAPLSGVPCGGKGGSLAKKRSDRRAIPAPNLYIRSLLQGATGTLSYVSI